MRRGKWLGKVYRCFASRAADHLALWRRLQRCVLVIGIIVNEKARLPT
jgi:hypothetical protein